MFCCESLQYCVGLELYFCQTCETSVYSWGPYIGEIREKRWTEIHAQLRPLTPNKNATVTRISSLFNCNKNRIAPIPCSTYWLSHAWFSPSLILCWWSLMCMYAGRIFCPVKFNVRGAKGIRAKSTTILILIKKNWEGFSSVCFCMRSKIYFEMTRVTVCGTVWLERHRNTLISFLMQIGCSTNSHFFSKIFT